MESLTPNQSFTEAFINLEHVVLGRKLKPCRVRNSEAFLNEQENFYRRLAAAKPKLRKFVKGWLNRLSALRMLTAV